MYTISTDANKLSKFYLHTYHVKEVHDATAFLGASIAKDSSFKRLNHTQNRWPKSNAKEAKGKEY